VLEIVQQILKLMDSALQPEILNQTKNEIRHQYLSAAKARQMIDWKPLFTLDEGLQQTISWYRDFLGAGQ
jgi:CDP-glucose 4,6-dehydratase